MNCRVLQTTANLPCKIRCAYGKSSTKQIY